MILFRCPLRFRLPKNRLKLPEKYDIIVMIIMVALLIVMIIMVALL